VIYSLFIKAVSPRPTKVIKLMKGLSKLECLSIACLSNQAHHGHGHSLESGAPLYGRLLALPSKHEIRL